MSELKVHKAYNRWIDEEMPTPNDDLICNEVYLKSESDKVIAELKESHKKEVEQLLMEIVELKEIDSKNRSAYYKDLAMMAKDVEHQKYKRCLAMARWCHESAMWLENVASPKSATFMLRWEKRWLELAEKFSDKEAK